MKRLILPFLAAISAFFAYDKVIKPRNNVEEIKAKIEEKIEPKVIQWDDEIKIPEFPTEDRPVIVPMESNFRSESKPESKPVASKPKSKPKVVSKSSSSYSRSAAPACKT